MRGWLLFAATLAVLAPNIASAERRIVVAVGNNVGAPGDLKLRFAQSDAQRVAQVFRELGSVRANDVHLLLESNAAKVVKTLREVRRTAAGASLFFYYSGHADDKALHLGSSRLPYTLLKRMLTQSGANLRIAIVDACQSGGLVQAKGFRTKAVYERTSGTAILSSAAVSEDAQEAVSLSGSIFTHHFISGLRGSADVDGDGTVTLSEVHSYASRQTRRTTATSGTNPQHPLHRFDIKGHGDVIMTRLGRAVARLEISSRVSGYVVVAERSASRIVVEAPKRKGKRMRLALPAGRYVAYVRQRKSVHVAPVVLPFGGSVKLGPDDLSASSYLAVASKGGFVSLNRHTLAVGGGVQSPILSGMGALPRITLDYRISFGRWGVGLRGISSWGSFGAVDTRVDNTVLGGGLVLRYLWPWRSVDLEAWAAGEASYLRQRVQRRDTLTSVLWGLGLGLGVRVPLWRRMFAKVAVESLLYFPRTDGRLNVRPTVNGTASLGVTF